MTRVDTRAYWDGHCDVWEPPDTIMWVDVQDETSGSGGANGSGFRGYEWQGS